MCTNTCCHRHGYGTPKNYTARHGGVTASFRDTTEDPDDGGPILPKYTVYVRGAPFGLVNATYLMRNTRVPGLDEQGNAILDEQGNAIETMGPPELVESPYAGYEICTETQYKQDRRQHMKILRRETRNLALAQEDEEEDEELTDAINDALRNERARWDGLGREDSNKEWSPARLEMLRDNGELEGFDDFVTKLLSTGFHARRMPGSDDSSDTDSDSGEEDGEGEEEDDEGEEEDDEGEEEDDDEEEAEEEEVEEDLSTESLEY